MHHQVLEALRVEWRKPAQRFTSLPERGEEIIKYFNFSNGYHTHNTHYRIYSRTLVPLSIVDVNSNKYLKECSKCGSIKDLGLASRRPRVCLDAIRCGTFDSAWNILLYIL